jgi:hypothetical protein
MKSDGMMMMDTELLRTWDDGLFKETTTAFN